MKKLLAALALTTVACATPALADVGVSVRIGEPGFYGQLDIGDSFGYGYRPRVLYSQPVVLENRYRNYSPIYVRVPNDHSRNWRRYCGRYNACSRPVYFVRDDWYRDVYVPRYRQSHDRNWRGDRRDDRRDWRDNRRDDRRDGRRDDRNDRRDGRRH